jgi:hypothetical protein
LTRTLHRVDGCIDLATADATRLSVGSWLLDFGIDCPLMLHPISRFLIRIACLGLHTRQACDLWSPSHTRRVPQPPVSATLIRSRASSLPPQPQCRRRPRVSAAAGTGVSCAQNSTHKR